MVRPFRWDSERRVLCLLDQRRLPSRERSGSSAPNPGQVGEAIRDMVIRGAPAIGIAAAYAVVLGFARGPDTDPAGEPVRRPGGRAPEHPADCGQSPGRARSDASSAGFGACPMRPLASPLTCVADLEDEANRIATEDLDANRRLGRARRRFVAARTGPGVRP